MNYLEKNKEQFINDLKGLIKIESYLEDPYVYPTQEMKDAVNYMVDLGNKEGFTTYADPEGYYGYIEIGQGEEMLALLGHVDVVPPGEDLDRWTTPAFELTIEDDLLKGRGTQDDKGPVMLGFYLLKSLIEEGIELNKRIRLIFPTDEESFWRGIEKYKADGNEIPVAGITPDSAFPIIYSERELYEFKIFGEPTDEFTIKAGAALNVVPDKATLIKDGETKIFKGKASHAMAPWHGDNAINKLLDEVDSEHELIKFAKNEINKELNGETIFGELIQDDDSQLSFNFAVLKMNSTKSELAVDIRIPNTSNTEELESRIQKLLSDKYPSLRYERYDQLPGVHIPLESELAKVLMESYQAISGDLESQPIATGGATYARGMENIVAYGPFFKDSPQTEHQYDEYVRFSDFVKAFDIYEMVFKKLN